MGEISASHDTSTEPHPFEEVTTKLFLELMEIRLESAASKKKIKEMEATDVLDQYPMWTSDDILDFKAQFQSFDINQDGLIDFHELSCVLTELGDESDLATRETLFREMDVDNSGGIDFEEYLELLYHVLEEKGEGTRAIAMLNQDTTENSQKVRRLSVVQQIEHGLF